MVHIHTMKGLTGRRDKSAHKVHFVLSLSRPMRNSNCYLKKKKNTHTFLPNGSCDEGVGLIGVIKVLIKFTISQYDMQTVNIKNTP